MSVAQAVIIQRRAVVEAGRCTACGWPPADPSGLRIPNRTVLEVTLGRGQTFRLCDGCAVLTAAALQGALNELLQRQCAPPRPPPASLRDV